MLTSFLNTPFKIGDLTLSNRLIQGPLAGFSCAPFRQMYSRYESPAYCVSEMISAHDVIHKHQPESRYLYRAPNEAVLCYQLAGNDPVTLARAAHHVERLGANLIDINCGCPKTKIRKKGAGSALLDQPEQLSNIINAVRSAISIPLTVKIRIFGDMRDIDLAIRIQDAGADALIVHGRRWTEDYDISCDLSQIARIKKAISIPVIANGDMGSKSSLLTAFENTGCDAYMISRAGSGQPWLYQHLLLDSPFNETIGLDEQFCCFMMHLEGLASLESEHKAVLQSKSLVRYYFRTTLSDAYLSDFYRLTRLCDIAIFLNTHL